MTTHGHTNKFTIVYIYSSLVPRPLPNVQERNEEEGHTEHGVTKRYPPMMTDAVHYAHIKCGGDEGCNKWDRHGNQMEVPAIEVAEEVVDCMQ